MAGVSRRTFLAGVSAVGCAVGLAALPGPARADVLAGPPADWGFETVQPAGRVLLDDSCASLAEAGWQVNPPANPGAYITDHAGTPANPLGVAFEPVPEGQYLMKGTPLAGVHISTDTMTKPLSLGQGSWQIAFRMAVPDLMQAYRLPQNNGLRLWVQCGDAARTGRYFDFNFMASAEVALVLAGGAYQSFPVPGGWDGEQHDWLITFDGVETVRIHLDGVEFGTWTYAGSAVVIAEGITFYNRTLDGVSGTNEIWFDQISVAATQDRLFSDAALRWADHWDVTPAGDTVFFADHDRSGGTTDWMTDVEAGLYFGRARQQGAGRARWRDPIGLGSGVWSVQADLRFAQFSYSGASVTAQEIVAGWDLVVDGQRYQVGWRPDQALVARSAGGTTVLSPAGDGAGAFHRLRLTRASSGQVQAYRDDVLLGTVPGSPVDESDRVDVTLGDPAVYGAVAVWLRSIDVVRGHPQTADACNDLGQYWAEPAATTGATIATATTPARAGEFLLRAATQGVGSVDLRVPIRADDGQWTLTTALRLADFRYQAADVAKDVVVFGWDVVVAGRRYRVGWRPDGAMVAHSADGTIELNSAPDGAWNTWPFTAAHTWRLGADRTGRLLVHCDGVLVGIVPEGVSTTDPDRVRLTVGDAGVAGSIAAVVTTVVVARDIDPVWFSPRIDAVAIDPAVDTTSLSAAIAVSGWDPDQAERDDTVLRWSLRDAAGTERAHGTMAHWHGGTLVTAPRRPGEYTLVATLEQDGRKLSSLARTVRVPRRCHTAALADAVSPGVGQDILVGDLARWVDDEWQQGTATVAGLNRSWTTVSTQGNGSSIDLGSEWVGLTTISLGMLADSEEIVLRIGNTDHVVRPPDTDGAAGSLVEWFATTADLTGQKISLVPREGRVATVAYVRLWRLDPAQARRAAVPVEGARGRRVIYNNDGTADIVQKKVTTADELRTVSAGRYRDSDVGHLTYGIGATTMAWANSAVVGTIAENYDLTPEQFALMRAADTTTMNFMKAVVTDDQCPLSIVASAGQEFGLPVLASLRLSAFYAHSTYPWLNGPKYPELYEQYKMIGFDGSKPADPASENGLSLTHAGYRQLLTDLLVESASLPGVAGVELDFCRRPRVLGWDQPFLDDYQQRYGVSARDEVPGPGLDRLMAHRAGILTGFLRGVRNALPGKKVCVHVPYGYNYELGLDLDTWVKEGLIDVLVPATWTQEDFWSIDSTFPDLVAGTKVELYGGIEAVINGQDSSKASEGLGAIGFRSTVVSARMTRQQYLLRANEFYTAGYDGVYIFNNPSGDQSLGQVGDKVAVAQWREFAYPAELHRNPVATA